ncbi:protein of unknown function DUF1559 [Pirellula staleyi DSM 6068]|uniref:DUF1559 domain-containing protein n=1 Tax=Pirellula staleyi (strain ATCC 27377 / DSM 6068 / ICPB 4128) TaxID=530564 RepID=D2R7H9_PIRSD|nr:DUF1559 domain-containing protein [Pirellula staleyi]ADB17405.1 protein of unknown function DUF1559 [Pirellula staleyi DSM 6068]
MRARTRLGFTLVELLVVIAIIGVLVALLLPAVQAAREAARRTQCQNNFKQIALGMHNHHDVHLALPAGMGPSGCCWGTWQVLILPYVEQTNVFDKYVNWGGNDSTNGGTRYSGAPNTTNVTNIRFKAFTCPSDQPNSPIGSITNHNYAVNFGNTSGAQHATLNSVTFQQAPFAVSKNLTDNKFKGYNLAHILDGTSNTLMVGEVLQGQGSDLRGFTWWGDACQFTTYLAPNSPLPDRIYTAGYCNNLPLRNLPCAVSSSSDPSMFASRSRHPGGVQVALCDGSSRFISQTVDMNVWRAISTAQGSEAVAVP